MSKFAKSFASKEVDGKLLLSLSAEVLRDQYGVTKPRDRTKFVKLVERLNEESEIAAHAERELKKDEIEREKLRIAKEERRAKARGEKGGGGGKGGNARTKGRGGGGAKGGGRGDGGGGEGGGGVLAVASSNVAADALLAGRTLALALARALDPNP